MAGATWGANELTDLMHLDWETFHRLWPDRTYHSYRFKKKRLLEEAPRHAQEIIYHDKATGEGFNWRDAARVARDMQGVAASARTSQETAEIELPTGDRDPFILFLSDTHIGDWGTDYDLFERITDEILETPDLYVALLGDLANMAIRLRGVAEVTGGNQLTPEMQIKFLESWLGDIAHKVAFATWDNHAVEREEQASGFSGVKSLLAKRVVYFGGIGHPDILVGDQRYKFCVSHRFSGSSADNPCHAAMRYLRREAPDRDLAAMGDYHVPGIVKFTHAGRDQVAINTGSTQTGSVYARRYFSLRTRDAMPGVRLGTDTHCITPYYAISEWFRER
jgi:hypothetical protein